MSARAFAVYEGIEKPIMPKYALHPYQRQVLADAIEALSSSGRRVVAHLPTGAGKTRLAIHAACHLLNQRDEDEFLVIWLASTAELCEQAADELARGWSYLGRREAQVHRHWGDSSVDLRTLESGFLVSGLAKLRSASTNDNTLLAHLAHRVGGVIFDEAHQAIAQTYSFVTEQLCSTEPPLLGLTATPGRTADLSEDDYRLAEMFNHTKVTIDPMGHESAVTYLIKNRYLAAPQFRHIELDSGVEVAKPPPDSDYADGDLRRLGQSDDRTEAIVDLAEQAVARHPRTIVFCPSVGGAVRCGELLDQREVANSVITAETSVEDRKEAIDAFRSDDREHRVMLNYGVLTAGFDAPRTRCVIVARPTTSLVLYSQMVGRGLRGPRAGGNPTAEIFTVVDTNLPGFGSVAEAFTNWESLWSTD